MSLSDYISDALPEWMLAEANEHWELLANTVAHVIDAMIDGLFEGRLAAMPGQIDEPGFGGFESLDALPFIGRDRRLIQGPTETPAEYAARLRAWRSTWALAGTAYGLLGAIRAVMVPSPPLLRVVSSAGVWWTLDEDGTLTLHTTQGYGFSITAAGDVTANSVTAHPWDWGQDGAPDAHRIFLIIYAPCHPPYLTDIDGEWGDGLSVYRATPEGTLGTTAPGNYVELLRELCRMWKPGGMRVPNIIIAFDPASFDPTTPGPYPAAGMPDGTWHHHGKLVTIGGKPVKVPSRLATARYWRGTV